MSANATITAVQEYPLDRMNPRLLELLAGHAIPTAVDYLRGHGSVPLFAVALAEDGGPKYLDAEPEDEPTARATSENVRLLRRALVDSGLDAGLYCAPLIGATYEATVEAMQLHTSFEAMHFHADHVDDPCAHFLTIPYTIGDDGEIVRDPGTHTAETDDLIFPRP